MFESIKRFFEQDKQLADINTVEFKNWFGNSKIVDSSGKPLVVYHGTNKKFNEFKKENMGKTDEGMYGIGFYFTNDKYYALDYGKYAMPVYLKIINPFICGDREKVRSIKQWVRKRLNKDNYDYISAQEVTDEVKRAGYDGIVHIDSYGVKEIVTFEPNQVKSIYNIGSWNSNTDNIFEETDKQLADINTVEFKNWFNGSKVVDNSGKPLVVYHGTNKKFDEFKSEKSNRGILFFTYETETQGYFFTRKYENALEYGNSVISVYLKLIKPLVDSKGKYDDLDLAYILDPLIYTDDRGKLSIDNQNGINRLDVDIRVEEYRETGDIPEWVKEFVDNGLEWGVLDNPEVIARMKELGYDGTFVQEDNEQSIFVLYPNQIKSMYNKGTWGNSNNIYEIKNKINEYIYKGDRAIDDLFYKLKSWEDLAKDDKDNTLLDSKYYKNLQDILKIFFDNIQKNNWNIDIINFSDPSLYIDISKEVGDNYLEYSFRFSNHKQREGGAYIQSLGYRTGDVDFDFYIDNNYAFDTIKLTNVLNKINNTESIYNDNINFNKINKFFKGVGGKFGGDGQTVWLPFEPNQIKSMYNKGTWNPKKNNISEIKKFMERHINELAKEYFAFWITPNGKYLFFNEETTIHVDFIILNARSLGLKSYINNIFDKYGYDYEEVVKQIKSKGYSETLLNEDKLYEEIMWFLFHKNWVRVRSVDDYIYISYAQNNTNIFDILGKLKEDCIDSGIKYDIKLSLQEFIRKDFYLINTEIKTLSDIYAEKIYAEVFTGIKRFFEQDKQILADTNSSEFKNWFGNSKIVDKQNKPLILYHGGKSGIKEFDPGLAGSIQVSDWGKGIYFTQSEFSADYYRREAEVRTNPAVNKAYAEYEAKAKELGTRPMDADIDLGSESEEYKLLDKYRENWIKQIEKVEKEKTGEVYPVYIKMEKPLIYQYVGITDPYLSEQAIAKGCDGIIIINESIPKGGILSEYIDEVVTFESNQIKSIYNIGSFSNSNNIYEVNEIKRFLEQDNKQVLDSEYKKAKKQAEDYIADTFFSDGVITFKRDNGKIETALTISARDNSLIQLTIFDNNEKPTGHQEAPMTDAGLKTLLDDNGLAVKQMKLLRPDVPPTTRLRSQNNLKFIYDLKYRQIDIGTVPDGKIEARGPRTVVYDRILTAEEIKKYELKPIGYEVNISECNIYEIKNKIKTLIKESSLSRVYQHWLKSAKGEGSYGIVTSYRSIEHYDFDYPKYKAEQDKRWKELQSKIRQMGLGYIPLEGWSEEEINGKTVKVKEPSLFIPDINFKQIEELAKKYDQDSFIYSGPETEKMTWLIDRVRNSIIKMTELHPMKVSQYYSRIKEKPFTLE